MTMDRQRKLDALRRIAMILRPDGPLLVLFGFLAGRLDRVLFVRQLEGAHVAVQLSADSRIWPRVPFRARVGEETVLNPIAFVDLMATRDDDIYVRVDLPYGEEPGWYREVLVDQPLDWRTTLEQATMRVRERIDFALDVYRTAAPLVEKATGEERRRLEFILETARAEIQGLSRKLSELQARLASGEGQAGSGSGPGS
ncbi:MAG TPA: hypothetical protein VIL11_00770 [Limnochordales bacterium]